MTGFLHSNNLIIGLGGTGGRVLRDMRKHLFEDYGTIPPEVAFLYIDSSEELIHQNDPSWMTKDGQDAQFNPCETLLLSPIPADSLSSSPEYYPALKEIAKNCRHMNYRGQGAMQDRRLGRVLLGFHANKFSDLLKTQIHKLQANSAHEGDLNITLVTGLSGGTGSGTVVSVASHILLQYPEAHVSIVAALPCFQAPPMHDIGYYHANAYAALRELNALNIAELELTDLVSGIRIKPTKNNSLARTGKLFSLFVFDNFFQEYDRISNILLHNLRLDDSNPSTQMYLRGIEMEAQHDPEYNASKPEGEKQPARTKAVGSLGFYQIALQQLIKYPHNYKEMTSTIRAALESACNSISMNGIEVGKVVRNNFTPWENPAIKPFTTVLVNIPHPTSAEDEELFNQFSEILLSLRGSNMNISFNNNYGNKDEIVIASVTTNFPLRFLSSLPELKARYDQLMSDDRRQAFCMLWTEDSFVDLPSLEVEEIIEQPKSSTEEDDCSTDIFGFPLPPKTPTA